MKIKSNWLERTPDGIAFKTEVFDGIARSVDARFGSEIFVIDRDIDAPVHLSYYEDTDDGGVLHFARVRLDERETTKMLPVDDSSETRAFMEEAAVEQLIANPVEKFFCGVTFDEFMFKSMGEGKAIVRHKLNVWGSPDEL